MQIERAGTQRQATGWRLAGRCCIPTPPARELLLGAPRPLRTHLDCGVTFFLDLTEAGELVPYESTLQALIADRGLAVEYRRWPVVDLSVPRCQQDLVAILDTIDAALAAGHCVYVHCWGGVGRRLRRMDGHRLTSTFVRTFLKFLRYELLQIGLKLCSSRHARSGVRRHVPVGGWRANGGA